MKIQNTFKILVVLVVLFAAVPAHAQYSVDWGVSSDNGNFGFDDLGDWFSNNGYAPNPTAGALFAQTGYVGFGGADSDPFSFAAGNYNFQVVQQMAGNSPFTSFGFYTGAGVAKSLTGLIGAGSKGPENATIQEDFGVYMNTPTGWKSNQYRDWFTDRAENASEQTGGDTTNAGGDPQALIYQLSKTEWLVAWEDLDYTNTAPGQSDRDYNDAYLKVTVTPEPMSMALFGMGGAVLAGAAARRRRKK